MEQNKETVFSVLSKIDMSNKTKEKLGFTYLSWSHAWKAVKEVYPDTSFKVYPQIMDAFGNTRPWHTDSISGWVQVGVTIQNEEIVETLPILDMKNQPIPADKVTSLSANKAIKRCLVKCIAMHGLALNIYQGEDVPEDVARAQELKSTISELIKKKCELSDQACDRVKALCVEAEKKAFPFIDECDIRGQTKYIDDVEILEQLKQQLLAVRK